MSSAVELSDATSDDTMLSYQWNQALFLRLHTCSAYTKGIRYLFLFYAHWCLGTGVRSPCGCWELNLGPLEEAPNHLLCASQLNCPMWMLRLPF